MIYYISEKIANERTAGSKARLDAEEIFKKRNYKEIKLNLIKCSPKNKIKLFFNLNKMLKNVKKDNYLVIQYPLSPGYNFFLPYICKKYNVIFLIHDLYSLRMGNKLDSEIRQLKYSKFIIAHNNTMISLLQKNGIKNTILNLEVFDYLTDKENIYHHANDKESVCFSGNLAKSKFIYSFPKVLIEKGINLYGIGLENQKLQNGINYKGSYEPDIVHTMLKGRYGLVWDGNSSETCNGLMGEYLKYNNPHKISMYIAAGMPIIIWEKAAEADFVKKNKIGISVASLNDIPKRISLITEEDYRNLIVNIVDLKKKITSGYYLNRQLSYFEREVLKLGE
ncbi:hypothetical protein DN432_07425 [Lactobacillus reuteri]|uniref:hypothetical protein n=1 Tax=Limosilactobacillus reuteri TaxID=1598 RepID=UPI00128CE05C|nr:hypothetical protein [Limosilactobacillus reuteri]MQB93614.1 hypothetical protein [Limosilactobacillus reuteri]